MRNVVTVIAVLGLLGPGCKKSDEATGDPAAGAKAAVPPAQQAKKAPPATEPKKAAPAAGAVDYAKGQSSGKQTEDVAGKDYRNTLVDRELGVAVTCPVDRTWRCKLGSDGKFAIKDMSANTFEIRAVPDVAGAAEAVAREIGYLKSVLPEVKVAEQSTDKAVLGVGANPAWARKVPRKAWLQIAKVGERFFACHGLGAESNYANSMVDYEQLCKSLAAPAAK